MATLRHARPHLLRRALGPVLALLSAVVLVLGAAPGASAASRSFGDARGDGAADITRVTVRWAATLRVSVKHARALRDGDTYTAYVSTDPDRPGPEYRAFAQPNSDVLGVRRISSWGDRGRAVRCPGFRASADTFDADAPVTFSVPAGCLGGADGPVRVTARAQRGSASDWAPRARRLGPAVRQG